MLFLVVDVNSEAKSFIKRVPEGSTLEDDSILIVIVWVTKDSKPYHSKFPRVLGFDVTFGTNAVEKRPLFRAFGKTSDNRNIPHVNAFIPSEQRWVFE